MLLLAGAFFRASASPLSPCSGGASLSGWYGMLVDGGGKYLSGALYFDGNCNVSGNNVTGGSGGQYLTTSLTGTYGQNSDGTFTITLNFAGQSTPQTYMVGISESGNKARGLESDGSVQATIDLQSQLTTLSSGYATSSLDGTYAASCFGSSNGSMADLNYVTFDGNGNLLGVDVYNHGGTQGNQQINGTYSVNGDGTFTGNLAGSLAGSYSFNGVIEAGVSQIEYTYNLPGTGGVMACVGKQSTSGSANLVGYYGILVGGTGENVWGRDNLSGSVYFDGVGGLTSTNLNGGLASAFSNTTATGTYAINSDNTISITMYLAGQTAPQTYVVAVSQSGIAASGIETDGTAVATVDLQSQLQLPTTPYNLSSLQGTYSTSCGGYEVDLNYVTFDGNGHILASVDAYDDGNFGDNPYTGTYTVNSDGTFIGNFDGPIYNVFTMTGVIENGTAEMEYSYYWAGFGEVVTCIGESTYGPVGPNPAAAAPTFTPAPGAYNSPQSVSLSAATPGTLIYYTTDGTSPTPFSPVYGGPIPVNATTTIQALAVAGGYNNSAIAAGTYFLSQASGQSQTITFPAIPGLIYPAGPLPLSATSSSGLPVSYAVLSGPANVSGNVLTILAAGSVTVQASQAGNGQYAPATPVSQTFTVSQASTTVSLTALANPSSLAQPITFTATVTPQNGGQASGTVTFEDGFNTLGVTAISANGASLTTSSLTIGSHSISAVYSGDSNFMGSVATPLVEAVNPAPTTTTLAPSINPALSGQQVSFTATVSSPAGTPTGYVQFLNGATVLAKMTLKSGTVKYSTRALAAGSNAIQAVYLGDSNNNGSTSATVNEFVRSVTTTMLASAPNPSVYGQPVVLTATVASSNGDPPDGETVTFKLGSATLGTGTLVAGAASFSIATLGTGSKALTAVYGGDDAWVASTSKAYIQVIGKASTTTALTSSQNPASYGQSVTFTATVTPQFGGLTSGNMTFRDGTKLLKTVALSGGGANFTTSTLGRGAHNITATYAGNAAGFNGSSGSLTQGVN